MVSLLLLEMGLRRAVRVNKKQLLFHKPKNNDLKESETPSEAAQWVIFCLHELSVNSTTQCRNTLIQVYIKYYMEYQLPHNCT